MYGEDRFRRSKEFLMDLADSPIVTEKDLIVGQRYLVEIHGGFAQIMRHVGVVDGQCLFSYDPPVGTSAHAAPFLHIPPEGGCLPSCPRLARKK